ncbi:MAG: archaemetzincin [Gammaproteobacteria bacterium]|nr:archaemetzincin [Gammaproteobacteria bacterium]
MVSRTLAGMLSSQARDIHIVPFSGVDGLLLSQLACDLNASGFCAQLEQQEQAPTSVLHPRKQKVFADGMLDFLRDHQGGRILGVMSEDLYRYVVDGIKGMADFVGRAAVISVCQLCVSADAGLIRKRLCKLALHELGHTYGLEHCDNTFCVMHDGRGFQQWDRASDEFCWDCCRRLQRGPYLQYL